MEVNGELEQQTVNYHNESITTVGTSTQQGSATNMGNGGAAINHRLKPVQVPNFNGDKKKFEEFWGLFESLIDKYGKA